MGDPLVFVSCANCRHYRMRARAELFRGSELGIAGVLKAKLEWEQRQRQRAEEEERRFRAGEAFDYEPHHYAWCAAYTFIDNETVRGFRDEVRNAAAQPERESVRQKVTQERNKGEEFLQRARSGDVVALRELLVTRRARMSPVTGEVFQLYALCDRVNADAACPLFDQNDGSGRYVNGPGKAT